jgi:hypothetical protein
MTFRRFLAAALVFAALDLAGATGCEGIKAPSFSATLPSQPTSSTMRGEIDGGVEQIATKAIMCDDAKLEVVKTNGGVFIGDLELHAEPNRSAINTSTVSDTDPIHASAAAEAANQGATHLIIKSSELETGAPRIGSSGINSSMYTFHYSLYRVPVESWAALPPALQPRPYVKPDAGASDAGAAAATTPSAAGSSATTPALSARDAGDGG